MECHPNFSPCGGGQEYMTYQKLLSDPGWVGYPDGGVSNDAYYPRDGNHDDCLVNVFPNNYLYTLTISDHNSEPDPPIINRIDDIKTRIIESGPVSVGVDGYGEAHSVAIVGWGTLGFDGFYFPADVSGVIVPQLVVDNPKYYGRHYWIVKNSWDSDWGVNGYAYQFDHNINPRNLLSVELPIIHDGQDPPSVEYYDLDNDGYYNWGIGNRPTNCPDTKLDSDDSEPRIGPYDEQFYGIPVAPNMKVQQIISDIPDDSFYTFYDESWIVDHEEIIVFTIKNTGNAQLNLKNNQLEPNVILSNETDFSVSQILNNTTLQMEDGIATFAIKFTLNSPINEIKSTEVTIQTEEPDMENFKFTLVFADCSTTPNTTHIRYGSTNWTGSQVVLDNIIVDSNAILTISGDIAFSQNANLYIDKGGIVNIDGGHLTSLCGVWPGIDVWGSNTRSQYNLPPALPLGQGKLTITNGGKISFAEVAIETRKYTHEIADLNSSGGIVKIDSGIILNCIKGVVFRPYKNFWPINVAQDNWSYIERCEFINNSVYPEEVVTFDRVDGIPIRGCSFLNTLSVSSTEPTSKAISSFNAEYTVKDYDYIIPDMENRKTIISGYDYGIFALGARPSDKIIVMNNTFIDNRRGIYFSSIDNPEVILNNFIVRDYFSKYDESEKMVGLYLDGMVYGFTIEDNTFNSGILFSSLEDIKPYGIVVNNSGQNHSELYNNFFSNLHVGISAIGENRASTGEGLCIKCNDFNWCLTDIYVTPQLDGNNDPITGPTIGIAYDQGEINDGGSDPTIAAGNTFSTGELSYFNNSNDCVYLNYVHQNSLPSPELVPDDISNLNLQNDEDAIYSKELSCPSNYNSDIDPGEEKSAMSTSMSMTESYNDTLNMLVDGGNTIDLNLEVATSIPSEALVLQQQLIDESPFLSDTVMKSAISKENVLPNAMIRDILVANPQSSKSPDVLNTLEERSENMPNSMMNEILQGKEIIGGKEKIEQKYARYKSIFEIAQRRLQRYYHSDTSTLSYSCDSILNIWGISPFAHNRYKKAFYYLKKGDSVNLYNTLSDITAQIDLSENELDTHNKYESLFDILWETDPGSIDVDSTYIQSLFDIIDHRSVPSLYSLNTLRYIDEYYYVEPIYSPEYLKTSNAFFDIDVIEEEDILEIFPNPAIDYCIIKHNFINSLENISYRMMDQGGNILRSGVPISKQSQFIIKLEGISPGVYFISIIQNGKEMKTAKLIKTI